MLSLDELSNFIVRRVTETWEQERSPYLLSYIGTELRKDHPDYKSVFAPQTLKQFVQTLNDKVTIVEHPSQRAKIGLIPRGENYSFMETVGTGPEVDGPRILKPKRMRPANKYVVMNFLELLGELEPEEAAKVNIPTEILARLLAPK